ncbi:MAG: hypothetical protein EOP06_00105 [Proteobacteria bacterium]|nr:MAG: hypothetical protein EOP06_00105 [Pseudomonadota bacterium]
MKQVAFALPVFFAFALMLSVSPARAESAAERNERVATATCLVEQTASELEAYPHRNVNEMDLWLETVSELLQLRFPSNAHQLAISRYLMKLRSSLPIQRSNDVVGVIGTLVNVPTTYLSRESNRSNLLAIASGLRRNLARHGLAELDCRGQHMNKIVQAEVARRAIDKGTLNR